MSAVRDLLDSGVIIIDKPPKLTSHEVTALVRRMLGAKRAGHAGTLDPNVTGVLPIALGRATKLLDYIVAKDKTYVGIIKFKYEQPKEKVLELFRKFEGEIIQTPPKISAVRKVPRKRVIHHIKLLEQNGKFVLFETKTQAGTYVRTLCEDIGKLCGGARMEELRRVAVGNITEEKAVRMHDLSDAIWLWMERGEESAMLEVLRPAEEYLDSYPRIIVKDSAVPSLLSGAQLTVPGVAKSGEFKKGERVAMYSENGKFIGMALSLLSSEELKGAKAGLAARTIRIHLRKEDL